VTFRVTPTIFHKLVALIVGLTTMVVVGLALYLSSQQIEAMTAALRNKAKTYGVVMAMQTTSAVAFSDRETAREVLESIDADADVSSVALYDAAGAELYSSGAVTCGVTGTTRVTGPRTIETATRIATVNPVVSLEGPRGVLVIELATDSLRAARSHVRRLALITGLIAIAAGALAAWWIARRLAGRLRAIANVASAVAAGDLNQRPVEDARRDEIGTLAAAFNAMLTQVAQRTAQLNQRTAEMQLVFDQVDQGLFMVGLDGKLASERSAAVERLLGPVPPSGMLEDYVRSFAPDAAEWFALQWEMLRDGVLPPELCLAQLPARFEVAQRHLELAYKLTDSAGEPRVLHVISDVTAQVHRRRAERDEREIASVVSRMLRGRIGFLAFHAEASQYVATIATGPRDHAVFRRAVHTLKGLAALEGIDSIAEHCHALETALAEGDELAALAAGRSIAGRWQLVTDKIAPLVAAVSARVELVPEDLARIEAAVQRGASADELLAIVDSWRHERIAPRLHRFADDAGVLATRLGKGPVEVEVDVDEGLRLPGERWGEFWAAFVHAIRNAIDHGLETAEERAAAGKPSVARLVLRAHRHGDEIAIEIADDGRGVDWSKVAELAVRRGLPSASHADLVEALFHDGFTTREHATEVSGRGIGLSALRHACVATGGQATIVSRAGAGTVLGFRWVDRPARSKALSIAG